MGMLSFFVGILIKLDLQWWATGADFCQFYVRVIMFWIELRASDFERRFAPQVKMIY